MVIRGANDVEASSRAAPRGNSSPTRITVQDIAKDIDTGAPGVVQDGPDVEAVQVALARVELDRA